MTNVYLVGNSDSDFSDHDFCLVEAEKEEDAILKYISSVAILEEGFQEHVYERTVNMSYAEHFWLQTPEENHAFNADGMVLASESQFKQRVRDFFNNPEWSDLFLSHYRSENSEIVFPNEMLTYMLVNSSWSDYSIFPLNEIYIVK